METPSYSDIFSTLSFLTALGALGWNIVRDFVEDRIQVDVNILFGVVGNIKNSNTGLFADAGSILPTHKFDNPCMLVQVINTGRKNVAIEKVGGRSNALIEFSIVVEGLPKMLQPYEIFSKVVFAKPGFIKQIVEDEIKDLWVADTKGKKWKLSCKGWNSLKQTAKYISEGKHH